MNRDKNETDCMFCVAQFLLNLLDNMNTHTLKLDPELPASDLTAAATGNSTEASINVNVTS